MSASMRKCASVGRSLLELCEILPHTFPWRIERASERPNRSTMRLEELISEFVARLAPCPPEQIDDEIEHGLGAILTLLGASRICWYSARQNATTLVRVYSVSSTGASPSPSLITPTDLPYTSDRLLRGETVAISRLDDLPAAAGQDRGVFERYSVRSVAFIPSSCATEDKGLLKITFPVERGGRAEL